MQTNLRGTLDHVIPLEGVWKNLASGGGKQINPRGISDHVIPLEGFGCDTTPERVRCCRKLWRG